MFGATARDGWVPIYNEKDAFHETFVTIGFLAAVTKSVGLTSGVLISPQRQTGLIAKQAAEADMLSGGRIRLGIGVGWNHVEYEALGMEWKTRGARQAEQVEVMRRLWSEDLVSFSGRFHQLKEVSILPAPVQRPIPIWFGGSSEAAVTRAAGSATAGCRSWRRMRRAKRRSRVCANRSNRLDATPPSSASRAGCACIVRTRKAGRRRRTAGVDSAPTW